MAEGARLESVFTGNRNVGSNPTPSATRIASLARFSARIVRPVDNLNSFVSRAGLGGQAPGVLGRARSLTKVKAIQRFFT